MLQQENLNVGKNDIIKVLNQLELQFRQMNDMYGLMVDKEIEQQFTSKLENVTSFSHMIEDKLFNL